MPEEHNLFAYGNSPNARVIIPCSPAAMSATTAGHASGLILSISMKPVNCCKILIPNIRKEIKVSNKFINESYEIQNKLNSIIILLPSYQLLVAAFSLEPSSNTQDLDEIKDCSKIKKIKKNGLMFQPDEQISQMVYISSIRKKNFT